MQFLGTLALFPPLPAMSVIRAGVAVVVLAFVLAGCSIPTVGPGYQPGFGNGGQAVERQVAEQFIQVVETVEPVAERECRRRTRGENCDFLIVVDDRPDQPPNAHQFVTDSGQPVIAFTYSLLETVRNADELAFVMGHEAAHHIAGHLDRQAASALEGATILGGLVSLRGGNAQQIEEAQQIGALIGSRRYSKDFELEADALGTVISLKAGFDPVRGAAFFDRLPDPGNQFLGTHPPNADRLATVRKTAAAL
ncbi:M48 family metallopeptidase [Thalassovita mediterranea]|jgi:Zn-dependent protease with chaperone function|uniref:TPR repeat-containing protein YfgC n=1 Tax=Thalassovita mediterranea TaxID=340021 RepID=A0A0N7M1D0_9RHOB|nr:M48 family metallopeptidase [Thalassovita mediterranea]CUH82963.1 TPR repeat-containing protein YfgC precursor [Thalassovita mediterranea]SIS31333.1 Peptidase family M48 [Thalassovita mediterranea]